MGLQRSSRQAGSDGFGGQQQSSNRFPPAWGDARMANTPQVGGGGWNGQGGGGGLDRPHVLAGGGQGSSYANDPYAAQGGGGQSIAGPTIGQSTGYPTVPASSLSPAPIYNGPALDINPRMNPLTGGGQGSSYAFDPWAGQGYGGGGLDRSMPYNPGMGVRNYPFMRRY